MHRRSAGARSDKHGTAGIAYDFKVARASLPMSMRRDALPGATSNEGPLGNRGWLHRLEVWARSQQAGESSRQGQNVTPATSTTFA